jgi:putative redox protein
MEAKVTWNGELSFAGSSESDFTLPLDAYASAGGQENGFKPMELLAIGLAGCTAMDVISILIKKRQVVTSFDVQVHADRAEQHPKVFTHAVIEYFVTGRSVDEAAVRRAIELSATTYCPAQAMLSQVFPIEMVYHIFEDQGGGERLLVKSGEYHLAEQETK